MKKMKVIIFSLIALFATAVPTTKALAACPLKCISATHYDCGGSSYSVNIQHGYKNSTGQVVFHGYDLTMGVTSAKCAHNNTLYNTGEHTHTFYGHVTDCGVSDRYTCTY